MSDSQIALEERKALQDRVANQLASFLNIYVAPDRRMEAMDAIQPLYKTIAELEQLSFAVAVVEGFNQLSNSHLKP